MGKISNARSKSRSDISCLERCRFIGNFKADGSEGGGVTFAVVGDHENRPTDMTNLVIIWENR